MNSRSDTAGWLTNAAYENRICGQGARDLIAIGDYIAKDNPLRAFSFVEELELHCEAIKDTPFAYALIYNRPEAGVRRAVHGRYGIFYRVESDTVYILHVLSSARNYEAILFPDT